MPTILLAIAVVAASLASAAQAAGRPVVLELFTSEGCSSCPPAEALLLRLAGERDLLPLAFHVTYWNALGWRDPYSFEGATERQAAYAERLGGGSYTPEMVSTAARGWSVPRTSRWTMRSPQRGKTPPTQRRSL